MKRDSEPSAYAFRDRGDAIEAARRVDASAVAEEAVSTALAVTEPASAIEPPPPIRVEISPHECAFVYLIRQIEEFGETRLQTTREGMELWVGGECRWRSGAHAR